MVKFLIIMNWFMSISFSFLTHPLSLGFNLLIQTILISLITGLMNFNYWFSYILFLVMIGGMLILFIYMTSIASNKKFSISKPMILISILILTIMMFLYFFDDFFFSMFNINQEMMYYSMNPKNSYSLNKFMNYPNMFMLTLIFIYLLISLIAVAKIASPKMGALRQKF
uniref:NADH-ubiquinone oxidoreductase chain 6 n=1 Tax=Cucujoidea sp. 8 KM-2017 TaxID=2219389 RepID=A0A346RG98_9CUCU|nr:NADH dehydrogenase subunit 6 [Cucujoidea sp. 8 KM-2017]